MKKEIVLIGKSPFINNFDLNKIKITKGSINKPTCKVDYCFACDEVKFELPLNMKLIHKTTGYKYIPVPNFDKKKKNVLGFYRFTVSSAVNWCYLNDFTDVYLLGIDHNENDKRFLHYDGDYSNGKRLFTTFEHLHLKQFIYTFKKLINIFQTNPDADWDLEYINAQELFA